MPDRPAHFRRLFLHDAWANRETLGALVVADEPPAVTVGRFAHVLAAELLWYARIQGRPAPVPVWPDWSVAECAERSTQLGRLWEPYLDVLTEDELIREVSYVNSRGEAFTSRVEDILTHVGLDSAYHRGQVAAELCPRATAGHHRLHPRRAHGFVRVAASGRGQPPGQPQRGADAELHEGRSGGRGRRAGGRTAPARPRGRGPGRRRSQGRRSTARSAAVRRSGRRPMWRWARA